MVDLTRVPVLIGGGQFTNRSPGGDDGPGAWDMLRIAAGEAAADAGDKGLLRRLSDIWLVSSLTLQGEPDAAGRLRDELGAVNARAVNGGAGGAVPQWLAGRAAEEVLRGRRPLVLIAGCEALATKRLRDRAGALDNLRSNMSDSAARGQRAATAPTFPPIDADPGVHAVELAHGLGLPTHMYALAESVVAHQAGDDVAAHRARMGRIMERLNAVAADNPYAWFPARRSAAELATPSPSNRVVCHPFTKYLCAIMDVDMAASVLMTDAQTARDLGLATSDVAFVAGWADAKDIWYVSERPDLGRSPAINACAGSALSMAGASIDDVTAFDLYSAFPVAVEVTMGAIGLTESDPRPLTLTGGLPYHGGAGNNYVTHSLVNTLHRVRSGGADETVLVHGNGYFLTKHAVGVYRGAPPVGATVTQDDLQRSVDADAAPIPLSGTVEGRGHIVAYTVDYDRAGGPADGIVVAEVRGSRTVAIASNELRDALVSADCVGQGVHVTPGAGRNTVAQV